MFDNIFPQEKSKTGTDLVQEVLQSFQDSIDKLDKGLAQCAEEQSEVVEKLAKLEQEKANLETTQTQATSVKEKLEALLK